MQALSFETKKRADELTNLIREFEFKLSYGGKMDSGIYAGKKASFEDMMTETNNFLDLTMPLKKLSNVNNHQNLY